MKIVIFKKSIYTIGCTLLVCLLTKKADATDLLPRISSPTCQGLSHPIGLDIEHPSFSWKLEGSGTQAVQQAYQIIVATSGTKLNLQDADCWNSGRISNGNAQWIKYLGKPLSSRTKYYWKILVWTADEKQPIESATAFFTTGLIHKDDWTAKWIGLDTFYSWDRPDQTHSQLSARYFRKTIRHKITPIKKATLYFTGLGLYKLSLNGQLVGTQELAPSMTDFTKRVHYNVFDLTNKLSDIDNTFGVILGNGRFKSMRPGEAGKWIEGIPTSRNFGYPKMIFQLEIDYTDGSRETIVSDETWKVSADGPIRSNNEYDGEVYDPKKEMPGWDRNNYNANAWTNARYTDAPEGKLIRQPNPDMQIMQRLAPRQIKKTGNRRFLIDMGQNMVGWVTLKIRRNANTPVVIRYAERLKNDSTLYSDNLRSAWVRDSIAPPNDPGSISWHPSFVYHGFRYVEVTGIEDCKKDDLQGQVVYDEMANTGSFHCSDSLLNAIYKAAWWTIAGNYKGLPLDCPQRDERMGWLGDRSINSYGESFMFDNYLLYAKWLDDIADAQLPNGSIPDVAPSYWYPFLSDNMTWPSSYLFVTDMLHRQFGDDGIVAKHYPGMKKWMAHMATYINPDSLIDRDRYGDWCMPPESREMILSKDSTRQTPKGFLASSYYVGCLRMMERFAIIAGHPEDSVTFGSLRRTMIAAVNKKYFNENNGYYANNTITANLLALAFDIVSPMEKRRVAGNIVKVSAAKFDNHLGTGLVGNQWLMRGLTDNGYADIAFRIATNTTYPSWGYMLGNGSTTIWELWNGNTADPAMNSGNHVMLLGDLMVWYYEKLAGIKALTPGFKQIEMNPLLNTPLTDVDAEHTSPYGKIVSHWTRTGKNFTWEISIPANTTARIHIPAAQREAVTFAKPGSTDAKFIEKTDDDIIFELLPGHYIIRSTVSLQSPGQTAFNILKN